VRWIVGYPAGGGTDVLARLLGAAMSARLGVPVVVENRPGAATNLGAEAAANAAPDGYTVFTAGNETLVFNPALYKRLPFDADNGLRPLGLMARFHLVLCAKPTAARRTPPASRRARRAAPARWTTAPRRRQPAPPGDGAAGARPRREAQPRALPRHGAGDERLGRRHGGTAVLDMAAGAEVIRSGRVRPLVLLSPARLPAIPDVPTAAEAFGLPASRPTPGRG
jgi:tripartite-type tricarboxylate transporter receptor subunit TctC